MCIRDRIGTDFPVCQGSGRHGKQEREAQQGQRTMIQCCDHLTSHLLSSGADRVDGEAGRWFGVGVRGGPFPVHNVLPTWYPDLERVGARLQGIDEYFHFAACGKVVRLDDGARYGAQVGGHQEATVAWLINHDWTSGDDGEGSKEGHYATQPGEDSASLPLANATPRCVNYCHPPDGSVKPAFWGELCCHWHAGESAAAALSGTSPLCRPPPQ